MPKIELITTINAPITICFDLARSIDLHKITTAKTNEEAIAGKTSGLISLNEFVTWKATHLGISQKLTTKITTYERPHFFVDEQIRGPFKGMHHKHEFVQVADKVIMKDYFEFHSPYGFFGHVFNSFYLTKYLENLLLERNEIIKEYAETDKWKLVLKNA